MTTAPPVFSHTGWHLPSTYTLATVAQVLDPLTSARLNLAALPLSPGECTRWYTAGWLPGLRADYDHPSPLQYVWLRAVQYLEALETASAVIGRVRDALFAPCAVDELLASPQAVAAAGQWQQQAGFPAAEWAANQAEYADPAYREEVAQQPQLSQLEGLLCASLLHRVWAGARYYATRLVVLSIEGSTSRVGETRAPHLYVPLTMFLLELIDPAQRPTFGVSAATLSPGEQTLVRTVRERAFKQLVLLPRQSRQHTHLDMLVTTHCEWTRAEPPTAADLRVPPHGQLTLRHHQGGRLYLEQQTRQPLD